MREQKLMRVVVRCYAELNDFLPDERRFHDSPLDILDSATVADILSALSIPISAVDLILLNGTPLPPTAVVSDGARLSLYPVFETFDISSLHHVHPTPLRSPRFLADDHLVRLGRILRMLGFDVVIRTVESTDAVVAQSIAETRTLLTRNRRLGADARLTHRLLVHSPTPVGQAMEVVRQFDLASSVRPFCRCPGCNALLVAIPYDENAGRLPERIRTPRKTLRECPVCHKLFWSGTHTQRMARQIDWILSGVNYAEGGDAGGEIHF